MSLVLRSSTDSSRLNLKKEVAPIKVIASHGYVTVTRKIHWEEQLIIENNHDLLLYDHCISDQTRQFFLSEILDISYKASANSYGWLYIHTVKGLFPYKVKEHPKLFIEKYRELK